MRLVRRRPRDLHRRALQRAAATSPTYAPDAEGTDHDRFAHDRYAAVVGRGVGTSTRHGPAFASGARTNCAASACCQESRRSLARRTSSRSGPAPWRSARRAASARCSTRSGAWASPTSPFPGTPSKARSLHRGPRPPRRGPLRRRRDVPARRPARAARRADRAPVSLASPAPTSARSRATSRPAAEPPRVTSPRDGRAEARAPRVRGGRQAPAEEPQQLAGDLRSTVGARGERGHVPIALNELSSPVSINTEPVLGSV